MTENDEKDCEFTIPSAPHWYKSQIMACAPDNTLVYATVNDLVVVREKGADQMLDIEIISAHTKYTNSVSLNKKWGDPHKLAVTTSDDNLIKVWDLDTLEEKLTISDHLQQKDPLVGAVFAGTDRIVSVTASGTVLLYNMLTQESQVLKHFLGQKVTVTCLSACPHGPWLVAFGLLNGLVVVADLRRGGKILYRLRGHSKSVTFLSWCPAPVNIFPKAPRNTVKNMPRIDDTDSSSAGNEECKSDEHKVKEEVKGNPWIGLLEGGESSKELSPVKPQKEHSGVGEAAATSTAAADDFLTECRKLKAKILGQEQEKDDKSDGDLLLESEKFEKEMREHEDQNKSVDIESTEPQDSNRNNRPLPQIFDHGLDFVSNSFSNSDEEVRGAAAAKKEQDLDDKDIDTAENPEEMEETSVVVETSAIDESGSLKDTCSQASSSEVQEIVEKTTVEPPPVFEEEPRDEWLLASCGRDRNVYIWRAGTDGRMQAFFEVPGRKDRSRFQHQQKVWVSMCWLVPNMLITSSHLGEVVAWTLPRSQKTKTSFKKLHDIHGSSNGCVFNIVGPIRYPTKFDWKDDQSDMRIWTHDMNGLLLNYDVSSKRILHSYSTLPASILSLDLSSIDPNRLAIGCRDGNIRIWDLSLTLDNKISMSKVNKKLNGRIETLSWHPEMEMILGFGTDEGRMGFVDVGSQKVTMMTHFFHGQVYKVEWGPVMGNTDNLGLYGVAEGKVIVYDTRKLEEEPIQLSLPDKLHVYKFAWKPDYSLLLMGMSDGAVIVLSPDLTVLKTLYLSDKGFNSIVWHPEAVSSNSAAAPRCHWFAASTTKGLLIYDTELLTRATSEDEEEKEEDDLLMQQRIVLDGHVRTVVDLAWSPFDWNKIVSVAFDGTAHVWDVSTKTILSSFIAPNIFYTVCTVWSPLDADLIITASRNIRVWHLKHHSPKKFTTPEKKEESKPAKPEIEQPLPNVVKLNVPKPKKVSKNCIVPSLYASNDSNAELQIANMKKLLGKRDGGSTADDERDEETNTKADILHLFGNTNEVVELLNTNQIAHKKEGRNYYSDLISLWKGDISTCVKEAIEENRVTPMIINLAPMVSHKLWLQAMEQYAVRLAQSEKDPNPIEAATYFLACHKVEEAVECLCDGRLYREALALAKCRLSEDSSIVREITEKWAAHCVDTGNFEAAALWNIPVSLKYSKSASSKIRPWIWGIYISMKEDAQAAKVLSRRTNMEFLTFAADLARSSGANELYNSIVFKREALSVAIAEDQPQLMSRSEALLNAIATGESSSQTENKLLNDETEEEKEGDDDESAISMIAKMSIRNEETSEEDIVEQ